MKIYSPVSRAIFKRDLRRWFGNPTGYVFITLFVFLCTAALFWPDQFFQANLANFDTLNSWFPFLLLFFVPAVTMSVWAGERGQGTDELLFTLPATDWEIVLGKFLSASGIYTVALGFTIPLVGFLAFLGDPDWGLLVSNYVGLWFLGLVMIGAGMVGSQLSANLTVAFILGALLCAFVTLFEKILDALFPEIARIVTGYLPISLFQELGRGIISLSSIMLFAGLVGATLYLNLALLSRRHWKNAVSSGAHYALRFGSVVACAVALTCIGANFGSRIDATSESVHSLSDETRALIKEVDSTRPVSIQAFISAEVPREYVQTRRTLLSLLREYDALGGDNVRVRIVEAERYSDTAREAEKNFGIRPVTRASQESGKVREFDMFLGVAFTAGLEEVVIPFVDRGLPVEYELTRSLRVVSTANRRKIGVLDTDVKLFGGFEFQTMRQDPEWEIVRELKLQYNVERVDPKTDYPDDLDVLLVAMPSSLMQDEVDRLATYVKAGNPALLIDDPFPAFSPGMGPTDPKGGPKNPFMQQQQAPPQPKGDVRGFLASINIRWPYTDIVWDTYNPHPQLSFEPELVFIGAGSGSIQPFNPEEIITSGLQEIVGIFSGHVEDAGDPGVRFIPLLRSSKVSGVNNLREAFASDFFGGRQLNPRRSFRPDNREKALACRVTGKPEGSENSVNAIFIADLDMIGSQFFNIRRQGVEQFQFDNVTFLLNCVDDLAGDTSFIDLRKRRPEHRTLTRIKEREEEFKSKWLNEKEGAEVKASTKLAEAKARLDARVKEVQSNQELDETSKAIRIKSIQDVEQRRLEVQEAAIEDEKSQAIEFALSERYKSEDQIRDFYRIGVLILCPIPGLFVGFFTVIRRRRKQSDVTRGVTTPGGAS